MSKQCHVLVLVCLLVGSCQRPVEPIPDGLEETVVDSSETGDSYRIRIALPASYNHGSSVYPVLYQLDGNTTTGSVLASLDFLKEEVREVIVVSISYEGENHRVRDFTPTKHPQYKSSGGGAAFLRFLRFELVPYVGYRYRVDEDYGNTLRGHSLGGLFASYFMLQPDGQDTFKHFIIESPSWWWDDNYIFELENAYSEAQSDLTVDAYLAVGELEAANMKISFQEMMEKLESRSFPAFEKRYEVLEKQNHLDVRENDQGLVYIFGR